MRPRRISKLLPAACWLTLIALSLFVWSVLDPRPIPVMLAMSLGQVFGTLATAMYLMALLLDLSRARVLSDTRKPEDS